MAAGTQNNPHTDRRAYRRLALHYDVSIRSDARQTPIKARSANVSTSGLYLNSCAEPLKSGQDIRVTVQIPPKTGLLETGGTLSARATIVRVDRPEKTQSPPTAPGIALHFTSPLKYIHS